MTKRVPLLVALLLLPVCANAQTDTTKTDWAWKKLQGVRYTTTARPYYSENRTEPGGIILQANDIFSFDTVPPSTPPAGDTDDIDVITGATLLEDTQAPVDNMVYCADFNADGTVCNNMSDNWIEPRYGASYSVIIKDNTGLTVPSNLSATWFFDYKSGVLTFASDPTAGGVDCNAISGDGVAPCVAPFTITGYRFIGKKVDQCSYMVQQASNPTTPGTDRWGLFFKSDGLYTIDDLGTVTGPLTAGGSGDVTAVGPGCATGACLTDGIATTGSTLAVWEGTTVNANDLNFAVPADPASNVTITFQTATGTVPVDATALTDLDGSGLTTSGTTLSVGAGTAITVNANDVAVTANAIGPTQIDETASYDWTGIHTFDSDAVQLDDTNASHQLILTPGSDLTADRVLTLTTGDAARTLTINGDTTLGGGSHSGTNTGDQTITLTGDVTGSGTGSFAATVADNAVDIDELAGVTAWDDAATKATSDLTISGVEVDFEAGGAEGYPRLAQSTTPPAAGCDEAAEAGRIYYDSDADTDGSVFVCRGVAGWKDIDDDGGGGGFTSFNVDGDNNSPQTITDGNELLIAGGTNGVDTVASATDTITINLNLSEASAGGELGGTLDAPTIDDSLTVDGWTLTTATITDPTLDVKDAAAPTPTVEGRMEWESDDDHLIVGDGAAQVEFVPAEDVSGDITMDDAGAVTIAANAVALFTDTTGAYVGAVNDGPGIDGTCSSEACSYTPSIDLTEISSGTWGTGSFTTFTFNAGATDPILRFGSGTTQLEASTFLIDDENALRFVEEDANGSNYIGFKAPAAITSDVTCTLENDGNPIPDSCVGDGTDAGGASGSGTTGRIPVWTATTTLGDSDLEDSTTYTRPTADNTISLGDPTNTDPRGWKDVTTHALQGVQDADGTIDGTESIVFKTINASNTLTTRCTMAAGNSPALACGGLGSITGSNTLDITGIDDISLDNVLTTTSGDVSSTATSDSFDLAATTDISESNKLLRVRDSVGNDRLFVRGDGSTQIYVNHDATPNTAALELVTNGTGGDYNSQAVRALYWSPDTGALTERARLYGIEYDFSNLNGDGDSDGSDDFELIIGANIVADFNEFLGLSGQPKINTIVGNQVYIESGDSEIVDMAAYKSYLGSLGYTGGSITNAYGMQITEVDTGGDNWVLHEPTNLYGLHVDFDESDIASPNVHGFAIGDDSNFKNGEYLFWSTALSTNVSSRSAGMVYDSGDSRFELDIGTTNEQRITATETTFGGSVALDNDLDGSAQAIRDDDATNKLFLDRDADETLDAVEGMTIWDGPNVRRSSTCQPYNTASAVFGCDGLDALTNTCTGGTVAGNAATNRMYISFTTGSTSGNDCYTRNNAATRLTWRPRMVWRAMTGSSITNVRTWMGLIETGVTMYDTAPTLTAAANTTDYVAIAYDDAISSDWLCCSGDGTNHDCDSMGLAVATSTEYSFAVDYSESGVLRCTVNTTDTTRSANLSTAALNTGPLYSVSTTTGSAKTMNFGALLLEQN